MTALNLIIAGLFTGALVFFGTAVLNLPLGVSALVVGISALAAFIQELAR